MSDEPGPRTIRVAFEGTDAEIAARLADALAGHEGIAIVSAPEEADVVVVPAGARRMEAGVGLLTQRELEVLMLLADGASNKAIARQLGISVHTAKFHVGSVIDKLDAVGRTDAVANAARLGVIHL